MTNTSQIRNFYLLVASAVFICGVVLASYGVFAFLRPVSFFLLSLALFLSCILLVKNNLLFSVILLALVLILGAVRYETYNYIDERNVRNFISYPSEKILVKGKVHSDPSENRAGKRTTFVLEANSIKSGNRSENVNGFVLVNVYGAGKIPYRYADMVIAEGVLRRPLHYGRGTGFDYEKYLANKRIYTTMNVKKGFFSEIIGEDDGPVAQVIRGAYFLRSKAALRIEKFFKIPYSAVLEAILLGKREKIPPWLKDLFARTGTLHILAISGLHVGIIYFALRVILKIFRIPKRPSIILTVVSLGFFAVLAGGRPSILRAVIMFSILAFGEMVRRKISVFNLLGLSCLMILVACPNQVFDLGFIFSYTAVLSIVCLSPIFYRIFSVGAVPDRNCALSTKVKCYFLRSVSVSLAAWVGIFPLSAHYFGLISPVVVIANLAVIPLVFMAMGSGLFFLILGGISRLFALIFAESTWFFLAVLIKSAEVFKNIPFGHFEINHPRLYTVLLYYAVLFIALIRENDRRKKPTFSFLT